MRINGNLLKKKHSAFHWRKAKKKLDLSTVKEQTATITGNQRGQAVVEYILVVIVSVVLIVALATKLIPPLNDFVRNYAGDYVDCLLRIGHIPDNPYVTCPLKKMDSIDHTSVNSSGGKGGSSSSSGKSGSDSSKNDPSSSNKNSSQTSSSTPYGSSSSGGSQRGPRLHKGSIAIDTESSSSSFSNEDLNENSKSYSKGSRRKKPRNYFPPQDSSEGNIPYEYEEDYGSGFTGVLQAPENPSGENLLPSQSPQKISKNKDNGNSDLRPQSFSAPVTKKKKRDLSNLDSSLKTKFSIRKILFYFIIGAIILALIVLVGTQLNSIRKSWGET